MGVVTETSRGSKPMITCHPTRNLSMLCGHIFFRTRCPQLVLVYYDPAGVRVVGIPS